MNGKECSDSTWINPPSSLLLVVQTMKRIPSSNDAALPLDPGILSSAPPQPACGGFVCTSQVRGTGSEEQTFRKNKPCLLLGSQTGDLLLRGQGHEGK